MYNRFDQGAIFQVSTIYKSALSKFDEDSLAKSLPPGMSDDAQIIRDSFAQMAEWQKWGRPTHELTEERGARSPSEPLREQLHDALARAKMLTSQVAMHLDDDWRNRLFEQLDDLLDLEDWHAGDEPIEAESFQTFLRMIIYHRSVRRPGLGLSDRGFLIAAWTKDGDRLTMEFFPDDRIRWVLSCETDGQLERASGETSVRRLMEVLAPYKPLRWLANATHQTARQ